MSSTPYLIDHHVRCQRHGRIYVGSALAVKTDLWKEGHSAEIRAAVAKYIENHPLPDYCRFYFTISPRGVPFLVFSEMAAPRDPVLVSKFARRAALEASFDKGCRYVDPRVMDHCFSYGIAEEVLTASTPAEAGHVTLHANVRTRHLLEIAEREHSFGLQSSGFQR
ncbi:MAG: hypothetical protein K2Q12_09220 [Rickettsiales bacterium]|nr:hypothetical protein [Rickettsiales bacterium]